VMPGLLVEGSDRKKSKNRPDGEKSK
jgi:hypothetical protein